MIRICIREEPDVSVARRVSYALAAGEGFPPGSAAAIATAVSEVARNIVVHAGAGEVLLDVLEEPGRRAITVVARDEQPGIADVERAMADGYTSSRGLGLGLPGARRLMDEFGLQSRPGGGTTVTMRKWAHAAR